ncbi:MAG: SMC-Scp complex subunit ScpB [Candidatus Omnitrophica bacterium]|nr:SMC-Scp complex subunit ScpB [Candidatus Omnitrophota bacterium]
MQNPQDNIKNVIEALIFANGGPLKITQIREVLGNVDTDEIRSYIAQLETEYEKRNSGIQIVEIAGGFRMSTNREFASFVKSLYKSRHVERLSGPSLETLAIIAYKQPVTRLDIESLRGVNVDGVVRTLLEKGLIRTAGRKDCLGRPFLYATTSGFLEYFGLKSLQDLPPIEEFATMNPQPQNVEETLKDLEVKEEGESKPISQEPVADEG